MDYKIFNVRMWSSYMRIKTKGLARFVIRAQELCESRGGRPGLPVPNSPCGLWT